MVKFMENKIIEILKQENFIKIDDLAKRLYVSPSTIRRKLKDLQSQGLVQRTHGGAKIPLENNYFPNFSFRSHQSSFEKKKIALSAIKLIKNGDVVFLDGSTSAFFVAEYLSEFENIKVYTNAIDTLSLLSKTNINVYSTGGLVSKENPSVLIGQYAKNTIKNIYADIAFFSAQSISREGIITDCFEEENFLRKAMMENSKKSVFLCDSSKFGNVSQFYLCNVNQVDYIISDKHDKNFFNSKINAEFITI